MKPSSLNKLITRFWWLPACVILLASTATAAAILSRPKTQVDSVGPLAIACAGSQSSNFDCIRSHYQYLVLSKGSKEAFDDLKSAYTTSDYVRSQCHQITHVIGRAAVTKYST